MGGILHQGSVGVTQKREERRLDPSAQMGPLILSREPHGWRLTLSTSSEIIAELPPDFEREISAKLHEALNESPAPIVMDLRHAPGLSSRELGALLAVRKALQPQVERVRLTGVSPAVRRLLEMTQIDRFFAME